MKKIRTIQSPVIVTMMAAFFIATAFCFCWSAMPGHKAEAVVVKSCHAGMQGQQKASTPVQPKDCDHCLAQRHFLIQEKINLNQPDLSLLVLLPVLSNSPVNISGNDLDSRISLFESPPEKLVSTVPTYLKHSVFRL